MKSTIINRESTDCGIPRELLLKLPYRLSDAIRREQRNIAADKLLCEELRIRCGRMSSLTLSGGVNLPLDISLSRDEMEETVIKLCSGSVYAYAETIKRGYISLPNGLRAGISGHAAVEDGRIIGISDINGICIRLPHSVKADVSPVIDLLRELDFTSGVLVYSPPGVGKTTLLRQVAAELSRGKDSVRVTVVDSRGELEYGLRLRYLCADVLSGYPKALGIEIALRTMGAQLIICDEIGNDDEVAAICSAANGGAALLASVHAADIEGLMAKQSIRELHKAGVFGAYVGISREGGAYLYDIAYRKDVPSGALK